MKVGILTQCYPPEPGPAFLPGDLAKELVRRGHDVTVVTGFPNHPSGRIHDGYGLRWHMRQSLDGVTVHRLALYPDHGRAALGRLANCVTFGAHAAGAAARLLGDCDVVWVSNSPPTVVGAMRRLRRWGVPTVLHVLDLRPDNLASATASGAVADGGNFVRAAGILARATYRAADAVLTISPGVEGLLVARGVPAAKIVYCPVWANRDAIAVDSGAALRREAGVADDAVLVLYAGAVGAAEDLETLVRALAELPPELAARVHCWVAGDGVGLSGVKQVTDKLAFGAPRIRFLGRRPASEMSALHAAADLCYVGLRPDAHAAYAMPSNVQATMAVGKALLASVPGDVDEFVRTHGLGFSSGGRGVDALRTEVASAVSLGRPGLARIGAHALALYEREFALAPAVDRIEGVLLRVADERVDSATPSGDQEHEVLVAERARPDDVDAIVSLHMRAFPGFFLTQLGPRFLRMFYADLCEDRQADVFVVKVDGRVIGFVGGVQDEDAYFSGLRERKGAQFVLGAASAALRDPRAVPRLWRARRRGAVAEPAAIPATLLSIAVEPSVHSRGVGTVLFAAFAGAMSERGLDAFKLTTDQNGNEAAIGFYRARGMRVTRSFATPEGRAMLEFVIGG